MKHMPGKDGSGPAVHEAAVLRTALPGTWCLHCNARVKMGWLTSVRAMAAKHLQALQELCSISFQLPHKPCQTC